jgi:glycosyltransferase involved in cell wall biosynthesis
MKLLILSRYDRQGASSRVRFMQYLPYLEAAGFEVELKSFFDADYLPSLYAGRKPSSAIWRSYARRIKDLVWSKGSTNLIWLEKEALPWVPSALEGRLMPAGIPLVSDFDDAVFHRYDLHRLQPVRTLLGRKFARVMKNSACVFAGNAYLANYARNAGTAAIEIVPTVVDVDHYQVKADRDKGAEPVIGWIGTPSTWRECVEPFLPVFRDVAQTYGVGIDAVGARMFSGVEAGISFLPWSEEGEIERINAMDIGVMPLPDTPWMRGKCGYKLIQYMACGLPVVASPVGMNAEIVEHGVNGFLAETDDDWSRALNTLICNPELRKKMGLAGRKRAEERYSLQLYGSSVASLLSEIAARNGTPHRMMEHKS